MVKTYMKRLAIDINMSPKAARLTERNKEGKLKLISMASTTVENTIRGMIFLTVSNSITACSRPCFTYFWIEKGLFNA